MHNWSCWSVFAVGNFGIRLKMKFLCPKKSIFLIFPFCCVEEASVCTNWMAFSSGHGAFPPPPPTLGVNGLIKLWEWRETTASAQRILGKWVNQIIREWRETTASAQRTCDPAQTELEQVGNCLVIPLPVWPFWHAVTLDHVQANRGYYHANILLSLPTTSPAN